MTTDPAHCDYVRSAIIAAYGEAGEEAAADEGYARAVRKRDELEAAFAAAIPPRMQKVADLLNTGLVRLPHVTEIAGVTEVHCSAILPDGARFTFEKPR